MAVAATTLSAAIATAGATTATVRDVLGFAASTATDDLVLVDSELMLVAGGLGTTSWSTITRGYASTTAATHADGSTVTRIERVYTDLARMRTRLALAATDTGDNAFIVTLCDAVNRRLVHPAHGTGSFIGPSSATSRVLDGRDAVRGGRVLWVPTGIRTATAMTIGAVTGEAQTASATTDWRLGPSSWEMGTGQPYVLIEFLDVTTGSWSRFPAGIANVTVTGTFGWDAVPGDLSEIADSLVTKMLQGRQSGQRDLIGSDDMGNALVSRFLSASDIAVLRGYRLGQSQFRSA